MEKYKSQINFNYETIRITKSRLDKGLLAIPVSLIDLFPKKKTEIKILLGDEDIPILKHFTPYSSSSRECRIGGLASWFEIIKIKDGDEIVLQVINKDEKIYRLQKESNFLDEINLIEKKLTSSLKHEITDIKEESEINQNIELLTKKVNTTKNEVIISEYLKIKDLLIKQRKCKTLNLIQRKENVPSFIRLILEEIYQGRCQITNFTFIQKNGKPYFEIHHLDENRGNDWRNLLVVCPNIHAQLTYSDYENIFDNDGWLNVVKFVNQEFKVNQKLKLITDREFEKIIHE